jgi:hypothetical protein
MPEWGRDTPWRQGAIVSATDLLAVGLIPDSNDSSVGVIVSHSCDIAQRADLEPDLEVIVATVNPKIDGNYSHGKNSRTLQLDALLDGQSAAVKLELIASGKLKIGKSKIAAVKPIGALLPTDIEILQRWLASRYRRSAFSDEFNDRLNKSGLRSKLETVLKKFPKYVSGIYFLIDDGTEVEHLSEDDPFALLIYVLYASELEPIAAQKEAAEVSAKITADFSAKCLSAGVWRSFELVDCKAISDAAMTFAQVNTLQRWNPADHISYRTVPAGVINDGEGVVDR